MKKEKLINEISNVLESATTLVKRVQKHDNDVHRLDIEVLLEKTRDIYDKLIQLDALIIPFELDIPAQTVSEPEEAQEPEVKAEEKDDIPPVPETVVKEEIVAEEVAEETLPEVEDIPGEEPLEEVSVAEKPEPVEKDSEEKIMEDTTEEEKSTIDLFSTSEPTISDKYSKQEIETIADKINKEGINELREAIGINEKFLFINELFNGDMSKYNKAIDELDELTTMEGVNTYLLELKIQNQWADDNPAFVKLTELLKRKFGDE
ncbi:MAG: hypothetical protein DRI88_06385 [Bacteroidetes bacterium]|nr:MAG: hypothetical protein DRI88_06385 [Bacteroidota bacterium]